MCITLITAVSLLPALGISVAPAAHSQWPTITERAAAKNGAPLEIVIGRDTAVVSLADLAKADVIVRGRLTNPRSYLSDDKHHFFTDYDVVPSRVILSRVSGPTRSKPGTSPLRVTLYGGTLVINGTTVTLNDLSQKGWTPGADVLLFLMRGNNPQAPLRPYGGASGMFEVVAGDRLKALRSRGDQDRGRLHQLRGAPPGDCVGVGADRSTAVVVVSVSAVSR